MRIAQCLEYPIQQHGGTEVLVREIIQGLAPNHEVVLVSRDDAASFGISSVAPLVAEQIMWRSEDATRRDAISLAARLKQLGVQLAHFHFGGTYGWGSRWPDFSPPIHLDRLQVPCIATNHGVFGPLDGYIGPQRSFATKILLWPAAVASRLQLIRHLRAEVAVSMNDYRALRRRFWPVRRKFRQIYHSRIHESDPLPLKVRRKSILCIGTVGQRKGQPFLGHAFARIAAEFADWDLLFVGRPGDEPTVNDLRAILERPELRARAKWIPGCSDEELKQLFSSVEIFAMPSLHEGLGLTLQEALHHGCACVASRIGGIQDLIRNNDNGLLVPPGNVSALADALSVLMRDESLRRRFQSRARSSVLEKQMTAGHMVANYLKLYNEVS